MDGKFFQAETVETPVRCVKIRFEANFAVSDDATGEAALLAFEDFVNRHLAKGYVHFNLDLAQLPFPATRLIALLLALTVRARRRQGDIKLLNVLPSAQKNFSTFNALHFLTVAPAVKKLTETAPPTVPKLPRAKTPVTIPQPQPVLVAAMKNEMPVAPRPVRASVTDIDLTEFMQTLPIVSSVDAIQEITALEYAPPAPDEESAGLTEIAEPPLIEAMVQKIAAPVVEEDENEKRFELRVESQATNLYRLCDFVTAHAFAAGVSEKDIAKMKIAVYEASLNVIEHAYHSRADEWIDIHVRYAPAHFTIIIQDYGLGFEMKPPKDYDVQEVMAERRSGGFGLHIIRRAMDSVEYIPDTIHGNRLVMVKRLH